MANASKLSPAGAELARAELALIRAKRVAFNNPTLGNVARASLAADRRDDARAAWEASRK